MMGLVAVHAVVGGVELALSGWPMGDFARYWALAVAPGRPYIDYLVEVPPGTLLVFKLLGAATGGYRVFAAALVVLNVCADFAIARLVYRQWSPRAALWYLACALPVLPLVFYRVDLWPTLMAAWAFSSWRDGRGVATGLAFAAGASLKAWPLPLALWCMADRRTSTSRRVQAAATLMAVLIGVAAAWFLAAGIAGAREVATFRNAQGWEIESTVGSLRNLEAPGAAHIESGAWRTGTMPPLAGVVLFAVAGSLMAMFMLAGSRKGKIGAAWIGAAGALMVLSPLFSAQYVVWLAPGAAIAADEGDIATAFCAALSIFLTGFYFLFFIAATHGNAAATLLIVARNGVVVAAVVAGAAALARRDTVRGPAPSAAEALARL